MNKSSWPIQNPGLASLAMGAGITTGVHILLDKGFDMAVPYDVNALYFGTCTISTYLVLHSLSNFRLINSRTISSGIRHTIYGTLSLLFPRNANFSRLAIETADSIDYSNPRISKLFYAIANGEKNLAEQVLQLSQLLETEKFNERSIFEQEFIDPLSFQAAKTVANFSPSLPSLVNLAGQAWSLRKWNDLESATDRIRALDPDNTHHQVLEAILLSKSGRDQSISKWEEIIQYRLSPDPIKESRNSVVELMAGDKSQGSVVAKISTHQDHRLKKEYEILNLVSATYDISIHPTVVPVDYFIDSNEQETLILFRRNPVTLDTVLEPLNIEVLQETIFRSMVNLAYLHSLGKKFPTGPFYNFEGELQRRFGNRLSGSEKEFLKLITKMTDLKQRFVSGDFVFSHCDFFPSNVFVDGTIFDLEKCAYAQPTLDLETFFGHPRMRQIDKTKAIQVYVDTMKSINPDFNLGCADYYAIHTSMCQIGSFLRKDPKLAEYFFTDTLEKINATGNNQLREPFLRTIMASKEGKKLLSC